MARVADIRTTVTKTVTEVTPVMAAVGATDLAAEKLREIRTVVEDARKGMKGVKVADVPARALNESLVIAGKAQEQYDALAVRGEELVKRLSSQQATDDLVHQAESTIARSKGAVTSIRKAVVDTERAAMATLTTGRNEAAHVIETVTDVVEKDAKAAADAVRASAVRTRTVARRTTTTAKNRTTTATRSTKAATTSAKRTAAKATKATTTGADKIGA